MQLDGLLELFDAPLVAPSEVMRQSEIRVDHERGGIELARTFQLGQPFVESTQDGEKQAIAMVRGGIIRIESDRALVSGLSGLKVPLKGLFDKSQRGVRLRQSVVQREGMLRCLPRLRERLSRGTPPRELSSAEASDNPE